MFRRILLLAMALSCGSCAWVSAVPINDEYVEGVRLPSCKPLIAVTGNAINVIWITNPDKEMALRFGAFLAKHDFSMEFTDQCLSKMTSNQDTTAVPIAFINLLSKALETGRGLGQAFSGKATDTSGGIMQLFDPVFDGSGNLMYLRPLLSRRDFIGVPGVKAIGSGTAITPANPPTGGAQGGQDGGTPGGGQNPIGTDGKPKHS